MKSHPSWEEILDWMETSPAGLTAPQESRGRIPEHIRGCPDCRRVAEEVHRLMQLFAEARLPECPVAVFRRVRETVLSEVRARRDDWSTASLLERTSEAARRTLAAARSAGDASIRAGRTLVEVWATLVADSAQASPPLRGGAAVEADATSPGREIPPRTLLYEGGGYAITLSVLAWKDARAVRGQVTPLEDAPAEGAALLSTGSVLLHAGHATTAQPLSDMGGFRFDRVSSPDFELEMRIADHSIRMQVH